jgi:hypothetical protein
LLELKSDRRELLMFGPKSAGNQCPHGIVYHAIEDVFTTLDKRPSGRWLINRMLAVSVR